MLQLLKNKGLVAFISVAFINAFVDLGHKIIIINTLYKIYDGTTLTYLSTIVNALILLPFIMLISPSGFIADRFYKNHVMQFSAFISLILVCLLTFFYSQGMFEYAFIMTFFMAVQSALYSPAKYGYIKDLLGKDGLTLGNALMQSTAIVAILCSMTVFSFLFEMLYSSYTSAYDSASLIIEKMTPLGFVLIALASLEAILSLMLPTVKKALKHSDFSFKAYIKGQMLNENMSLLKSSDKIFMSVIGVSLFFAVSQLLLAVFPTYIKQSFNELNTFYVQLVLGASGLGIIAGSYMASRLSDHYIETGLIPLGALMTTLCSFFILSFETLTAYGFLFFIFGIGFSFVIIPLNAMMQFYAEDGELGKILAGNNFIQNIAMISFLAAGAICSVNNIDVVYLFYLCMITVGAGSIYIIRKLPFSLARGFVSVIFRQRYRLHIEGFDNVPQTGGVMLLGNHVSFIDWAILQLALPRKVYFVIDRHFYDKWYLHFILKLFGVIPVSSSGSKKALNAISLKIKEGHMVCLFPEGCLSRHGHLNIFKKGFELALKELDDKDGVILPFYMKGLWGSAFSRSHAGFIQRQQSFKKRYVSIAFGRPLSIHTTAERVKSSVAELSLTAFKNECEKLPVLPEAFINRAKKFGSRTGLVDSNGMNISYIKMLSLCLLIKKRFKNKLHNETSAGIMLPASMASSILNMALLLSGKVIVNLNFTASSQVLSECVSRAQIKTVFTSRQFLDKLYKRGIRHSFDESVELVFAEDLFSSLKKNKASFLFTYISTMLLPAFVLRVLHVENRSNRQCAAILFSSGSEGKPKGVMLSHMNIMSNIVQIADVIQARDNETILSSLPPFHAFGLTVTTLLPLIEGIKSVTHADPTDAQGIGRAVARHEVSILCGTSTFLGIYARSPKIAPVMFESLRVVVSGAEKLKNDVREAFSLKFKKDILEGYGATETTPVVSVNLPDGLDRQSFEVHRGTKTGSVGMPLPGSTVRIVDKDTLQELEAGCDGLVLIGGHQVMMGYLNDEEKTDEVIVNLDGIRWYKSGDKGHLDKDGFLHIVDRYSRFAKVGGEMISLGALEEEIGSILRNKGYDMACRCVALSFEDSKKGEKIALMVTEINDMDKLKNDIASNLRLPLSRPSVYFKVDELPLLGSGKIDFAKAKSQLERLLLNH